MMPTLGEYSLTGALLAAMVVVMAALVYLRSREPGALRAARGAMWAVAGLLTVSSWALLNCLLQNNFAVEYVAGHSSKALPLFYKISAFWAGQEGSLLLWAWLLGVMGVVFVVRLRRQETAEAALGTAILGAVIVFFTALMLFAGDPFALLKEVPGDGAGLKPILQNIAMVVHPPTLFIGYAGFTAPFAMVLAALLTGRRDMGWLGEARGWILFSWIALTVGIVLGAWWAYVELNWGGYWAWDPVENASLLPWLTGTALLHAMAMVQRRGIFKRWTAFLIVMSFLLCIFGTYLTRSGVVSSQHSFGDSPIGTFFLIFLAVATVGSVGVILVRLNLLQSEHPLEELVSREGLFLGANVLLTTMTALTLVGTIFPVLSAPFQQSNQKVTVDASFYNKAILPMGVALAALMAIGPLLGYGAGAAGKAKRALAVVGAAGAAGLLAALALGMRDPWGLMVAAVATGVVTAIVADYVAVWRGRRAVMSSENPLATSVRVFLSDRRRWGAQLAHLGMAAVVVGVAGSSLYKFDEKVILNPGDTVHYPAGGGITLTYRGMELVEHVNYQALPALVDVVEDSGARYQLAPEARYYHVDQEPGAPPRKPEEPISEVAMRVRLSGDVYLSLVGWDFNKQIATLHVIVTPLVDWIWIGSGLMVLGAVISMFPRRRTAPAAAGAKAAAGNIPCPA